MTAHAIWIFENAFMICALAMTILAQPAASSQLVASPETLVLAPRDKLAISVEQDPVPGPPLEVLVSPEHELEVPVSRCCDSTIKINVRGKKLPEAQTELKKKLEAEFYKTANVSLKLLEQGPRQRFIEPAPQQPVIEAVPQRRVTASAPEQRVVESAPPAPAVERAPQVIERATQVLKRDTEIIQRTPQRIERVPQERVGQVTLSGAVLGKIVRLEPGKPKTLREALSEAGPTEFARLSRVRVDRVDPATGETKKFLIDIEAIEKGDRSKDLQLLDGDRIMVPERWFNL
jgi:protein involved in polysaccharide export with SLBB domain